MNQRHKHYDVIVAFAEGKQIQYRRNGTPWKDTGVPGFYPDYEYRVKPEVLRYRNFLCKYSSLLNNGIKYHPGVCTWEEQQLEPREKWHSFVCWLGDWQEAEVPTGESQ